jgi:Tfp pilus assembly protein PilX
MITTNRKLMSFPLMLSALMLLFSCASAPVQEMSDARQAIQAAREAGAQNSTQSSSLEKAEALLKEAELSLENGEYKKARLTAVQARDEALRAQKDLTQSPPSSAN